MTYCRNSGDVSAAAKVDVDRIPSICVVNVDGSGDNSDTSHGHQLPLVQEAELPGQI